MNGVRSINHIEETGPLVHIDKRNLPDLDDLMLEVLGWLRDEELVMWDEESWTYEHPTLGSVEQGGDQPTSIPYIGAEPRIGYYRRNPCACGDEHTFDLGTVAMDDDGNPLGKAARGAFLGVWFS